MGIILKLIILVNIIGSIEIFEIGWYLNSGTFPFLKIGEKTVFQEGIISLFNYCLKRKFMGDGQDDTAFV